MQRQKSPSASGVSDLDLSSEIESKITPPWLLQTHQKPSLLILTESCVSLHTVCSLILPSDHNGGHAFVSVTDNIANARTSKLHKHNRRLIKMTLCMSAQVTPCGKWPCMDATVHTGSKIENNKCSSGWLTDSHYVATLGVCNTPSHCHAKLFSAFWWKASRR